MKRKFLVRVPVALCALGAAFAIATLGRRAAAQSGDPTYPPPLTESAPPPAPPPIDAPPPTVSPLPPPIVAAPPAPVGEAPPAVKERFGRRGQLVFTGATSLGVTSTAFSHSDATSVFVSISPGVDYFVADHVSVGADFTYGYSDVTGYGADGSLVETTTTSYGFAARLGLNLPLGDLVSIYLRTSFGYGEANSKEALLSGTSYSVAAGPLPMNESNSRGTNLNVYAPLLLHLAPHFFVGAGPSLYHDLTRTIDKRDYQNLRTTLGLGFVVGGWL